MCINFKLNFKVIFLTLKLGLLSTIKDVHSFFTKLKTYYKKKIIYYNINSTSFINEVVEIKNIYYIIILNILY